MKHCIITYFTIIFLFLEHYLQITY